MVFHEGDLMTFSAIEPQIRNNLFLLHLSQFSKSLVLLM